MLALVKFFAFISDFLARLPVCGAASSRPTRGWCLSRCPLNWAPEDSTLEPIGEPVVELEVVGSVYCYSFSELSEVLWVHRVNHSRT